MSRLNITIGESKWQTFWELLTCLICLVLWGNDFVDHQLAVLGDNVSSLTSALNLKGKREQMAIIREISWRQARYGWSFAAGHIPSEANHLPDALSRLTAIPPAKFPTRALHGAVRVEVPPVRDLWVARLDRYMA